MTEKELVENSWPLGLASEGNAELDEDNLCCFTKEALHVIHTTKRTTYRMRIAYAELHQRYIQADWYDGWEKDLEFWLHVEKYWTEKLEEYKQ